MNIIVIIWRIALVLAAHAPELYAAFKDIMALIPAKSPEPSGKMTMKAHLPDLADDTPAVIQQSISDYEKGAAEYKAQFEYQP